MSDQDTGDEKIFGALSGADDRSNVVAFRPAAGADLSHDEQLEMAASYIERAMGRVSICIAALETIRGDGQPLAQNLIEMLDQDVHDDLGVAREIFQAWKAQEARS